MEIKEVIQKIKTEVQKIYSDLSSEMPSDSDPQSIAQVKRIASVASANATQLALYLKELTAYKKKREAEITLKALDEGLKTPKEAHLKALLKSELADVYAYEELCSNVLDICKQRVVLAQSFLKVANTEGMTNRGAALY